MWMDKILMYIYPGAGGSVKKSGRFSEDDLFSDPIFSSSGKDVLDGGRGSGKKPSRTGRFKIIGDSKKSASLERGEEMKYNPKVYVSGSFSIAAPPHAFNIHISLMW